MQRDLGIRAETRGLCGAHAPPTIPVGHKTTAGLLLEWPAVQQLVNRKLLDIELPDVDDYPTNIEKNRKPLDLGYHVNLITSSIPNADSKSVSGHCDHLAINEADVWQYVDSFRHNILIMHPVIQLDELEGRVKNFLGSVQFKMGRMGQGLGFLRRNSHPTRKREFSAADLADDETGDDIVNSALIFSIIALGQICSREKPDSPVVCSADSPFEESSSPKPAVSFSSAAGRIPQMNSSASINVIPEFSFLHEPQTLPRSFTHLHRSDIPGIEYYEHSVQILKEHQRHFSDLQVTYVNIFLGIYHGLLGRPMDSFSFIRQACHNLESIIRP